MLPDLSSPIHGLAGHSALLDALMRTCAEYLIAGAVILFVLTWLARPDGLRACLAAGGGALVAIGLSGLIGMLWNRPRPFVAGHFAPLISHAADASFPSDHVAALAAVGAGLWFSSRRLGGASWILAAVVGFARVYVGVHYVSDILGGAMLGVICGFAAWAVTGLLSEWVLRIDVLLKHLHLRPDTD